MPHQNSTVVVDGTVFAHDWQGDDENLSDVAGPDQHPIDFFDVWNVSIRKPTMTGRMDTFGLSHPGLVRDRNEDQFLIADLKKSVLIHQTSLSYDDDTQLMGVSQAKLFIVADVFSNGAAGEQASRIAIQGIVQYLLNTMHWLIRTDEDRAHAFMDDLKSAVTVAQEKIQQTSSGNPSRPGGDASITMAYVVWPQVWLVYVGAGHSFLFRDRQLMRLTLDRLSRQILFDAGPMEDSVAGKSSIPEALSVVSGCRNGPSDPVISRMQLALHDKLLLCTDGLTEQLTDTEISRLLSADSSACEICQQLVGAANDAGGRDNTTVVLAHFTDGESTHPKQAAEAVSRSNTEERSREAVADVPTTRVEASIAIAGE